MTRKITFILLLAISSQLVAETVYIRDILDVPLGGCQSQDHRIQHRGLRNGLMLERLETNRLTGYSRVRTEGWLESKYHLTEPMAVARLYAVISKLQDLEAQLQMTLLQLREAKEAKATTVAKLVIHTETEKKTGQGA